MHQVQPERRRRTMAWLCTDHALAMNRARSTVATYRGKVALDQRR
jgi:hypothetical protein